MSAVASRRRSGSWIVAGITAATLVGCDAYDHVAYEALFDVTSSDGTDVVTPLDTPPSDAFDANDVVRLDASDANDASDVDDASDDHGSDAPVPDVQGDASLDDTSCDDFHAAALFCDGFEDPTLARWSAPGAVSGTAARDTNLAYRGAASFRAEITAGSGTAYIGARPFDRLMSGDIYMRGYYYFPSGYDISSVYFLTAITGATPIENIGMQGFNVDRIGAYSTPGMRFITAAPSARVVRDRWMCMEMHIAVAPSGTVELFVDGTLAATDSGYNTVPAAGFSWVYVGITYVPDTQTSATVYADEIVIDDHRIGCD